ncbi:potassium channel family protein [Microcoleus sp. FACHB-672]|uniref:potassium channel family protein n=1 Tax=Microcoleus sp. FACHB-672 TaxID=2692825 RepID=UPI001686FA52|nr:NAD-binding protein [Microcoleus sp. FACHB-672]MBD2039742.1 NAD-binding protein [Microcoleus sp. FACHB-672]
MKPRIIVCGLGCTGYKIFCLLRQQGADVVGISDRPLIHEGADIIFGDLREPSTLLAAGIREAQTLVLAGADDALNLAILVQSRVLNPRIRIINRLFNASLGDRLDQTVGDHVTMSVSTLAAPVFAFAALGKQAIGQLQLFHQTWPIHEEYIDENHPWLGRHLSHLWENRSRMLIYYLPVNGRTDLISAMSYGQTLQVGDRLIVASQPRVRIARNSVIQKVTKFFNSLQQFHLHTRSTLAVLLSLFVTILIATLTYICVNSNTSAIDALYFSVGMITGAGGNEKVAEHAPESIKLFTAVMMLVGAGIIGICYALLNDFVLGTRFTQVWDATRIPQRSHYIICGLGGVGLRIADQLRMSGHEVVVIERDPNCRFINTARALKIPVILGDASVTTTLTAGNIDHAEALIAVTSDDTANLEIALTAKSLVGKLPVVVRNQDPQFARMVEQVFEFEAVLSPTELAAPSFAAAALGGRIFGNGMTGDSLWVALATLITPSHPFCGHRVREVAMSADFVPLYIETNCQSTHGWDLLNSYLSAGDVLYLTMPATKLDQLWRTQASNAEADFEPDISVATKSDRLNSPIRESGLRSTFSS